MPIVPVDEEPKEPKPPYTPGPNGPTVRLTKYRKVVGKVIAGIVIILLFAVMMYG